MKKVVIHIFHADNSSLGTGSHVTERIRQVKDQHGVELEVYVFGPAERALDDPAHADETCPAIPHVNRIHWPIPDPAKATGTQEEVVSVFRGVRDDIARRVRDLLKETCSSRNRVGEIC